MEVHAQVPVSGEEALVHIVKLVVILHQQLQAGLITAGCAHGLKHNTHVETANNLVMFSSQFVRLTAAEPEAEGETSHLSELHQLLDLSVIL